MMDHGPFPARGKIESHGPHPFERIDIVFAAVGMDMHRLGGENVFIPRRGIAARIVLLAGDKGNHHGISVQARNARGRVDDRRIGTCEHQREQDIEN